MAAKVALVTGASGSIGSAVSRLLTAHAWRSICPKHDDLDFSDHRTVALYEHTILNRPNILRISAVVFCHGEWFSSDQRTIADWDRQYRQRVVEPEHMLAYMLGVRHPIENVVMVSSTRGLIGGVESGPYACAAAAQIALMQGYAREWPGVRFNVVAPGLTRGKMEKLVRATGGCKKDATAQAPESVARHIVDLIESGANGKIIRVADNEAREVEWQL